MGFQLSDPGEKYLYHKWLYWKNGISAREFRNEWVRDMRDIMDIENAVSEKQQREQAIVSAMRGVKF